MCHFYLPPHNSWGVVGGKVGFYAAQMRQSEFVRIRKRGEIGPGVPRYCVGAPAISSPFFLVGVSAPRAHIRSTQRPAPNTPAPTETEGPAPRRAHPLHPSLACLALSAWQGILLRPFGRETLKGRGEGGSAGAPRGRSTVGGKGCHSQRRADPTPRPRGKPLVL